MGEEHKGLPVLSFASRADWDAWLDHHGALAPGLWIKFAKKGSGLPCVGKAGAVEIALIHGWIDGQLDTWAAPFWLTRFTPRGSRSKWSRVNRKAAEGLTAAGKMKPAGLAAVELAKDDGRWDAAYPSQAEAEIPEDFQRALDADPAAAAFFATLGSANRYAVLYRLHNSAAGERRAARIRQLTEMLARGEAFHPQPRKRVS